MPQPVDPGLLIGGFRGAMYRSDGSRWATCTTWEFQVNVTTTDEQPLGTIWTMAVAQSMAATLTASELVIDDTYPRALLEGIQDPADPHLPVLRFIGERRRPDGQISRLMLDACTFDGTNTIASATPGSTMTRDYTFRVNNIPDPAGLFPAAV